MSISFELRLSNSLNLYISVALSSISSLFFLEYLNLVMEIQQSSLAIFHVNRVFGLAPYLTRRNKKGRIDDIKFSVCLCIYSLLVLTAAGMLSLIFADIRR